MLIDIFNDVFSRNVFMIWTTKLNFDLNSAKNVLVKRQNSSESISIQFSHQEQVEEIIDILKTPTKKNTTEAKETKTGLVGKSIENNAEESEDGNAKKSQNEKLKRYVLI